MTHRQESFPSSKGKSNSEHSNATPLCTAGTGWGSSHLLGKWRICSNAQQHAERRYKIQAASFLQQNPVWDITAHSVLPINATPLPCL